MYVKAIPVNATPRGHARTSAIVGTLALAAASLGIIATTATTAEAAGSGAVTGYQGMCLDDYDASSADGAKVDLYTCNNSSAQQWTVESNGTLQVFGMCMDVNGGNTTNGTVVDLYTCNGTGAQDWMAQPSGDLVNPQSGKCLADSGDGGSGTQVVIYDCSGASDQKWTIP